MSIEISAPYPFFTETNGAPLEAGNIYIGTAGLDPENNQVSVYWDKDLTIPATQPLRTIAGYPSRSGAASNFYTSEDYSIVVKNKFSAVVHLNLSSSISSEQLQKVTSYTQLKALSQDNLINGNMVFVQCRSAIGDGGQGWFRIKLYTLSPPTEDNGTILQSTIDPTYYFERVYEGFIHAEWFVDADGTTQTLDDFVDAYAAAVSAGVLLTWDGTIKVDIGDPANTTSLLWSTTPGGIAGGGRDVTKLELYYEGTGTAKEIYIFRPSKSLTLENMSIIYSVDAASKHESLVFDTITWGAGADRIVLDNVYIDGNVDDNGSAAADLNTRIIRPLGSGARTGLFIKNCLFENLKWGYITDNSWDGTVNDVKILNSKFDTTWAIPLTFNAPNGAVNDCTIDDVHFKDNMDNTGFDHCIAWTGRNCKNGKFSHLSSSGACGELLHSEEGAHDWNLHDCHFLCDDSRSSSLAVFVITNSVGGVEQGPYRFKIHDNNFIKGTTRGDRAIYIFDDGSSSNQPDRFEITNNRMELWDYGIQLDLLADYGNVITGNQFNNCTIGIQTGWLTDNVYKNVFRDCSTAIKALNGGGGGHNIFYDDVTTFIDVNSNRVGFLNGFTVLKDQFDDGTTGAHNILICPMSADHRMSGDMNTVLTQGSTNRRVRKDNLGWNGTTLTITQDTQIGTFGGGTYSTNSTPYAQSSSNLYVSINNATGGGVTGVYMQHTFNGVYAYDN